MYTRFTSRKEVHMRFEEDEGDIVYSTEAGDLRKDRGKKKGAKKKSKGRSGSAAPPGADGDGSAKVRREKKGRGGKTVTAVYGLNLDPDSLKEVGKQIKQACGTGGSVKNGVIEIQGDMVDQVISHLENAGYRAKRAGG
jgi:translation initiation factor 1